MVTVGAVFEIIPPETKFPQQVEQHGASIAEQSLLFHIFASVGPKHQLVCSWAVWGRLWGSLQWRFSAGWVCLVEVDSLVVLSCVHLCIVLHLALRLDLAHASSETCVEVSSTIVRNL